MSISISKLLIAWLKNANYIFDEKTFRQQFLSHPNAPGVSAITDTLNDLSIDNAAIEIPFTELHKLDHTFMAYIKQDREEQFAMVQKKDDGNWQVTIDVDKQIIISSQKLEQLFTGLVILIDPAPVKKLYNLRRVLQMKYIMPVVIALAYIVSFSNNIAAISHFIFGAAGLLATMLIAAKDLGFNTGSLEKFCNLSSATNCEEVLKSRFSSITGNSKLYDLSLVFFATQTFFWLFCFALQPAAAAYQYIVSLAVVPVTLASLYVQGFVLKKWCPLCLTICAVLWSQAIVGAAMILPAPGFTFNLSLILAFGTAAAIIWAAWHFIKELLQKTAKNEELNISQLSFRRNYHLFIPFYRQLPEMDTSISGVRDIVLGPRNGSVNMIVVSNPLCKTCIALHSRLHQWVSQYPGLSVTLRFYVPVENNTDKRTLVAAKLVELYMSDAQRGLAEMDEWYRNPDVDDFYKRNSRMHSTDALEVLKRHRKWCLEQNIFVTPSIIINRKRFPVFYEPEDAGYFIEEIGRAMKNKTNHTPEEAINAVLS